MARKQNRLREKLGKPPGSIVFVGDRKVQKVQLRHVHYNSSILKTEEYDNHQKITLHESADDVVDWYDIRGLHDVDLIRNVGDIFKVHPLVLEDIANTHQRPKFDEYDNGLYLVFRAIHWLPETMSIRIEQISLFFRKGLVLSFQEDETDLFASIKERIFSASGRIRGRGADYLAYALLDSIVDHYFIILDDISIVIEELEARVTKEPDRSIKMDIHQLKKELLLVRRSVTPLREAMNRFSRTETSIIDPKTELFIRDLNDHVIQIIELVDTSRDLLNGLQELYIAELSLKMNKVMQVLTLMATIFIPLTFLVGVYGMNFKNIPELEWKYSYFVLWGIMIVIFIMLMIIFKRKRWFNFE